MVSGNAPPSDILLERRPDSAGFININAIPLHDLTRFNQKKDGMVESITINGNDEFEEEEVYPKNANILITYHSK